jgi:hypothetical protein
MDILCRPADFPDLAVLIVLADRLHRRFLGGFDAASTALMLCLRRLSRSWRDFVEQADGALSSALRNVLEQTLRSAELVDKDVRQAHRMCKGELPALEPCRWCSNDPGARCCLADRVDFADIPQFYAWIRAVSADISAPAVLLLALRDEASELARCLAPNTGR